MPFTREVIRESVERAGDEHWKALRDHHEDAYPASRPTPGDVCKAEAERLNEMGLGERDPALGGGQLPAVQSVRHHHEVEPARAERQRRRVRNHEPGPGSPAPQTLPRRPDRGTREVHCDDDLRHRGEVQGQLALAAPHIEQAGRPGSERPHEVGDEPVAENLGGAAAVLERLAPPVHVLEQPGTGRPGSVLGRHAQP